MAPSDDDQPAALYVDQHVGLRVRELRRCRGVSQEALADAIGVTFQQVQKYEKGANRISASKLFAVSVALGVEVDHFFQGLRRSETPLRLEAATPLPIALMTAEALHLDSLLLRMSRPRRRLVVQLAEGLALPTIKEI